MSLIDALQSPVLPQSKCGIFRILSSLNEDERKALEDALERVKSKDPEDAGYTQTWLAGVLRENGYSATDRMVSRHTRGDCQCR